MEIRKIKVVMLGPYLYEMGGVTTHIRKLAKYLSRRDDIELHIITISNENKQIKDDNFNVHVIKKSFIYPFSIPSVTWRLRRKILEIAPDIIHAQGTIVSYSTAAALVRNKYPTLLTVHGIVSKEIKYSKGVAFFYRRLFTLPNERYVLSKVPDIVVCSPQMKELIRNLTNSKIHVLPNGIDFEDILNIGPYETVEYPSILYLGNLSKIKGIDVLLKAVPIIRKKIPNLHIYIAGSGTEEEELKKLVKELNIEENVKFLGFISDDEKYSYYKSADVCVFPSIYEPFGIVLLEAMACGKPVVASNVGGIPFVVVDGKTGLVFESGNVNDLAEKVVILLKNKKLREKMGDAGKERAKEFTWDKIAEQTVDLYKEILGGWSRKAFEGVRKGDING